MNIPDNPSNDDIRDALLMLNQTMTNGFQGVNQRIDQCNERIDQTNERIDQTNERLDQTNERIDQTNERLDQTNERLDQTNERLDQTNERVDGLEKEVEGMRADVVKWDDRFFQLTRDSNARANAIIIAAASVVVLSAVAQALPETLEAIAHLSASLQ